MRVYWSYYLQTRKLEAYVYIYANRCMLCNSKFTMQLRAYVYAFYWYQH